MHFLTSALPLYWAWFLVRLFSSHEFLSRLSALAVPQNVVNVLCALVKMGERADRGLLQAMQWRATATAGEFGSQGVANMPWALATTGGGRDGCLGPGIIARFTELNFFNACSLPQNGVIFSSSKPCTKKHSTVRAAKLLTFCKHQENVFGSVCNSPFLFHRMYSLNIKCF